MTVTMRTAATLVILAMGGLAYADEPPAPTPPATSAPTPDPEGKPTGLLIIPGLDIGGAHAPGDTGFLLGGEVSVAVVHFKSGYFERDNPNDFFYMPGMPIWGGVYGDVVRDFGHDATRISLGPEIGYGPIGIDGGYVHQFAGDRSGYVVRPVLTIGILSAYFRFGHFTDDMPGANFQEFGVLLKWGPKIVAW